jgi:drug/metabolite transporter (DMT)-like permease
MKEISALDRTVAQLGISAVVMLPYTLIFEPVYDLQIEPMGVVCLAVVCFLHTGVAYALYFGSVGRLSAQTAALCSYIDPVETVILSAVILRESVGIWGIVGAVLVIGAALVGELEWRRKADADRQPDGE